MKKVFLTSISILVLSSLFAQTELDKVWLQIEENNSELAAYKSHIKAEQIENKTDIFLANPEIELKHVKATENALGSQTEISVTQSFEFPTSYVYKKQISRVRNEQLHQEYKAKEHSLKVYVYKLCSEIIYKNALAAELDNRLINAQRIAESYKQRFNAGEVNIIEYNKSQIHLKTLVAELENNTTEKSLLLSELQTLNNNKPINLSLSSFPAKKINPNYEEWASQLDSINPEMLAIEKKKQEYNLQHKLAKSQSLPSFTVGFVSEQAQEDAFTGAIVGMSIPLWENKNKVKTARLYSAAILDQEAYLKQAFNNSMREQYFKIKMLQKTLEHYYTIEANYNSAPLLEKAFNSGQISLIEYMQELELFYDVIEKKLALEKEINLAYSELINYM